MKRFAQHSLRIVPLEAELFHALRRLVLCSIVGATLGGCINFYRATGSEPTDLSAIQVGATRQTVERVLGEPVASGTEGSTQIATYEYSVGIEAKPASLLRVPAEVALIFLPSGARLGDDYFERPEAPRDRLTITYGPDDTVVEISGKPLNIQEALARAEQGDAEAQYELAYAYLQQGRIAEALRWLCLAANQSHPRAQFELGNMHRWGNESVTFDFVQAYLWLSLAASGGFSDAGRGRAQIATQMTPAQIAEAEKLVKKWKPGDCELKSAGVSS